jgi:hypothetical protein
MMTKYGQMWKEVVVAYFKIENIWIHSGRHRDFRTFYGIRSKS